MPGSVTCEGFKILPLTCEFSSRQVSSVPVASRPFTGPRRDRKGRPGSIERVPSTSGGPLTPRAAPGGCQTATSMPPSSAPTDRPSNKWGEGRREKAGGGRETGTKSPTRRRLRRERSRGKMRAWTSPRCGSRLARMVPTSRTGSWGKAPWILSSSLAGARAWTYPGNNRWMRDSFDHWPRSRA